MRHRQSIRRRPFSVLRTALFAVLDTYGIESAADDVITNTRKILDTAASDEDDAVFLQIVSFARNISGNFDSVRQTYTSHLTKSGVRLLRGRGVHSRADTALLRALFQSRGLRFIRQSLSAFANQLIDCRQYGHLLSQEIFIIDPAETNSRGYYRDKTQAAAAFTLIPHALPNSFFEKSAVTGTFFETQASRSGSEIRRSASDAMNTCTASPFSSARIVSLSPTAKAQLFNSSNFMISPAFARTKSRATLLIYHPRKNLSIKFRKISDTFAIFFTTSPGVPMLGMRCGAWAAGCASRISDFFAEIFENFSFGDLKCINII